MNFSTVSEMFQEFGYVTVFLVTSLKKEIGSIILDN